MSADTKTCSKCGEDKPLDGFHRDARSKDGRQRLCVDCKRAYQQANKEVYAARGKAWREANPERVKELGRRWRAENAERHKENGRRYRAANKERLREKDRRWVEQNPDAVKAKSKRYYDRNAEKLRAKSQAWRATNPDKNREQFRNWKESNPEAYRANKRKQDHARRAREACAVPQRWTVDHSLGDPLACWWCGRGLLGAEPHLDHVMPIALNGPSVPDNEVVSCSTCNLQKRETHPLVWIARQVTA